ncbi:LacI family transcriptional regulator [Opitutaceae bacterium TAV4]|uniref:LacI family DNA-binding transcriptional regulator n=1 Tax=Geminisphaera colitermitum TaxID=1148786 RepID=UPI000158D238|nr:LacI family DNA-binding transcriptional regulator [Geminisphaera colitermitum]RRJ94672.1 LacI family transcriptional regulator [Opitutaceae bacterium TAV4]RRJ98739.1 LacI family transcriptional regulator [Opitutaceae bacterium TAV3]
MSTHIHPENIPPSQRDIARAAGASQGAVSLALNNSPRLSTKLRDHIQAVARQLGYRPNPYLSGLSAYRKQRRRPNYQATLAWVSSYPPGVRHWRDIPTFQHYFEGASRRANELGYQLEAFELATPDMTPARMSQILKTRNIPGILIAPQPGSRARFPLNLDHLSAITFGYTLAAPRLHLVTHNHFRGMEVLVRTLRARGYRRIGLALEAENDLRFDRIIGSAFLREQSDWPASSRIPIFGERQLTPANFLSWMRRYKPDAIATYWEPALPTLLDAGLRVPADIGLAMLSIPHRDGTLAGMWENPEVVGARALESLVEMVHRGERGIPEHPSCVLIESTWTEGKTIRPSA